MQKPKIVKASERDAFLRNRELSVNTRRPEPKSAIQAATEFFFGNKTAEQFAADLRNKNLDGLAKFAAGH